MIDLNDLADTDWEAMCDDDGEPMLVVRPVDPAHALKKAKSIVGMKGPAAQQAMDAILREQAYTFQGYADRKGNIRDAHGKILGKMLTGDSFVSVQFHDKLPPIGATMSFATGKPSN